jgi:hypothetical protein
MTGTMSKHQVMTPGDYKRYLQSKGFKVLEVFEEKHNPRLVANILVQKDKVKTTDPHCSESIFTFDHDFEKQLQLKVGPEDAKFMFYA